MINEEKVILMTHMQAYEDHVGKKDIAIANYFRGDYLGYQVLKAVLAMTVVLAILFGCYVLYDIEFFMKNIYQMDLLEYIKGLAKDYVTIVVIYAVLTYVVYTIRYAKAKKHLKKYYGNLKKLSAMYNKED